MDYHMNFASILSVILTGEYVHFLHQITKMLPGRTDNAVKNRFHAACRQQSRKEFGEDEKMNYISGGFDCNTDCESVEVESPLISTPIRPLSAIPRIDREKIFGCYSSPSCNDIIHIEKHSSTSILGFQTSNLYAQSSYDQKGVRERCDKVSKPAKKMKKSTINMTTVVEQEKVHDTAYLNELYITKLNEFFATPSVSPSMQSTTSPIYVDDLKGVGTQITHGPQQQNYLTHSSTISPSYRNISESTVNGPTLSMPALRVRTSPLGQPFRSPLGQPYCIRRVTPAITTGTFNGVAFHELSLKDRLAPAQSHSLLYTNNDNNSPHNKICCENDNVTTCNSENSSSSNSINVNINQNINCDNNNNNYSNSISVSNNYSNNNFTIHTHTNDTDFGINTVLGSDLELQDYLLDDWVDEDMIMTGFYDSDVDVDVPCCQSTYEWATNECSIMRNTESQMCTINDIGTICSSANDFDIDFQGVSPNSQTFNYPPHMMSPQRIHGSRSSAPGFFSSMGGRLCGNSKTNTNA